MIVKNNMDVYKFFPHPREKRWQKSPQKQIVRAGGVLPPHPQSSARSLLIVLDFPQKMFELCPEIAAKTQNRIPAKKSHRRKPQKEDGTAFLPRPLLPCRPHFCWRFWGFRYRFWQPFFGSGRACFRTPRSGESLFWPFQLLLF